MSIWTSQLAAGTIPESLRMCPWTTIYYGQCDNAISRKALTTGNYTHWYEIIHNLQSRSINCDVSHIHISSLIPRLSHTQTKVRRKGESLGYYVNTPKAFTSFPNSCAKTHSASPVCALSGYYKNCAWNEMWPLYVLPFFGPVFNAVFTATLTLELWQTTQTSAESHRYYWWSNW